MIASYMRSIFFSKPFRIGVVACLGVVAAKYLYKLRVSVNDTAELNAESEHKNALKSQLRCLLQRKNVHCADIDYVWQVIDSLISSGSERLQVIADFDRTMTPLAHNGSPVPSCHTVVESCPNLPHWYTEQLQKIKSYYLSIEVDPNLTNEEKTPFMEEWWNKSHDLLISSFAVTKANLSKAVSSSNLYLRKGSGKLLQHLCDENIPLLIFSAGVGDVIEQALKQRYKHYSNIRIIANWMEFNHEGALIGFKGDNIHVYNKSIHAIENCDYFDARDERHNVILLGDSLGDLDIAEGLPSKENMLTIGYLNHHIEDSLPEYMKRYDIVLAEEDGIELLQSLLENITTNSAQANTDS